MEATKLVPTHIEFAVMQEARYPIDQVIQKGVFKGWRVSDFMRARATDPQASDAFVTICNAYRFQQRAPISRGPFYFMTTLEDVSSKMLDPSYRKEQPSINAKKAGEHNALDEFVEACRDYHFKKEDIVWR